MSNVPSFTSILVGKSFQNKKIFKKKQKEIDPWRSTIPSPRFSKEI